MKRRTLLWFLAAALALAPFLPLSWSAAGPVWKEAGTGLAPFPASCSFRAAPIDEEAGMGLAQPAAAQQREFLTDGEIYQIREAQEPDQRLKLYVQFAQQRLDAVEKELAADDAARTRRIYQNLSEYDRIIDAIDRNVEQALGRHNLMRKGLEAAVKAEPEFLKLLEAFRARNPKDLREYRFILDQAMETTKDSFDSLREALAKQPKGRKQEKEEKEEKKKQGREKKGG